MARNCEICAEIFRDGEQKTILLAGFRVDGPHDSIAVCGLDLARACIQMMDAVNEPVKVTKI